MKVFLKAGLMLCLNVLVCACSKKENTTAPQILHTKYLSRLIETDSLFSPGSDTVGITSFSYDPQNRFSERVTTGFQFNTHIISVVIHENWFYNGGDTLPYKTIVKTSKPSSPDDTQTHFLFYQNGIIIKDSIEDVVAGRSGVDISRALFDIQGSSINSKWDFYSAGNFIVMDSAASRRTFLNGNVLNAVDTFFAVHYSPARINWISNYSCSYDLKNNPFNRVNLPYPVVHSSYFFHWQQKAFNNPQSGALTVYDMGLSLGYPSTTNSTILLKYEYDADNYPVVARPVSTTALPVRSFYTYLN